MFKNDIHIDSVYDKELVFVRMKRSPVPFVSSPLLSLLLQFEQLCLIDSKILMSRWSYHYVKSFSIVQLWAVSILLPLGFLERFSLVVT